MSTSTSRGHGYWLLGAGRECSSEVVAHFPFGPRGSTVSGRHLNDVIDVPAWREGSVPAFLVMAVPPPFFRAFEWPPAPPIHAMGRDSRMTVPTAPTCTQRRPTWRGRVGTMQQLWGATCISSSAPFAGHSMYGQMCQSLLLSRLNPST